MWNDSTVTNKVKSELLKDSVTKAFQIDVDTLEGNVYLKGIMDTKEEPERAFGIAKSAPGVRKATKNLQVGKRTLGQSMDDTVTGSGIKAKLVLESGMKSLNIYADVYNGIVTSTGMVDSNDQRKRAIDIARSTSKTARIVNNIKVKNR